MQLELNEIDVLSSFIHFRQKALLAHPLTETYLHLKWLTVKNLYFINIFLYVLYLLSLTVLTVWTSALKYHIDPRLNETEGSNNLRFTPRIDGYNGGWYFFFIVSFVSVFLITIRELIQLANEKQLYFKSYENMIEMIALAFTWIYLWMTPWVDEYEQLFGAFAMFFGWLEMTLMLGRIPSIGMYTYMSTQVLRQLIMFFMVYITTLFAFAISLHMLLIRDEYVFDNLWTTCLKVSQNTAVSSL